MNISPAGGPSSGQSTLPTHCTPNKPSHLNETALLALLALPFISVFVGIDDLHPTKAVYALYDASTSSLRFTHGDGTLLPPEQVCFRKTFQSGGRQIGTSQRVYFMELLRRSTKYYQLWHSPNNAPFIASCRKHFPDVGAVRFALEYYSDLRFGPGEPCPALSALSLPEKTGVYRDQGVSCVTLGVSPVWNFDPKLGFQPLVHRQREAELRDKHELFMKAFAGRITWEDFQKAAFCLAGLERAGFVSFVQRARNDARYFVPGTTPALPLTNASPLRTSSGWAPDCFLIRFRKFEHFIEELDLAQVPNPIAWLEAQLEDELRLYNRGTGYQVMRPWKGTVNGENVQSGVNWETLRGLEWQQSGNCYPQRFASSPDPVLPLDDFIGERNAKFVEPRAAKAYNDRAGEPASTNAFTPTLVTSRKKESKDRLGNLASSNNNGYGTQEPISKLPQIHTQQAIRASGGHCPAQRAPMEQLLNPVIASPQQTSLKSSRGLPSAEIQHPSKHLTGQSISSGANRALQPPIQYRFKDQSRSMTTTLLTDKAAKRQSVDIGSFGKPVRDLRIQEKNRSYDDPVQSIEEDRPLSPPADLETLPGRKRHLDTKTDRPPRPWGDEWRSAQIQKQNHNSKPLPPHHYRSRNEDDDRDDVLDNDAKAHPPKRIRKAVRLRPVTPVREAHRRPRSIQQEAQQRKTSAPPKDLRSRLTQVPLAMEIFHALGLPPPPREISTQQEQPHPDSAHRCESSSTTLQVLVIEDFSEEKHLSDSNAEVLVVESPVATPHNERPGSARCQQAIPRIESSNLATPGLQDAGIADLSNTYNFNTQALDRVLREPIRSLPAEDTSSAVRPRSLRMQTADDDTNEHVRFSTSPECSLQSPVTDTPPEGSRKSVSPKKLLPPIWTPK